jgi:hypothetical protein
VKELHKFDDIFHRVDAMEEKFLRAIRELPAKVVSKILDHIQVNGAVPISAGQVQTLVTSLEARLLEAIANQARILQPAQQNQDQLPDVDPDTFTPWLWGGVFHRVPEFWRLPVEGISISMLWSLWWGGIPANRIRPLRRLRGTGTDLCDKNDRGYLTRCRYVMNWPTKAATAQDMLPNGVTEISLLTVPQMYSLFVKLFTYMCTRVHPELNADEIVDRRMHSYP